jgi:predicted metal-dependent phosphoesterase TrpH
LHSTASDGAFAPAKLMDMGKARQLSAIALTDHDTIAGHEEALISAASLGIMFVPGVEVEAAQGQKIVHLLAYLFDGSSPELVALLSRMREMRESRNRAMAGKLCDLGISIDYEQMRSKHGSRAIGRPHFATELMRRGVISQFRQAFGRYLGRGAAAYVARESVSAQEVIESLHRAGGVVSLAHPSRIPCESTMELENLLYRLRDAGLDAIEVRHPDIIIHQARDYEKLAQKLGLALSGGSDFHALGAVKRGVGFSGQRIPMAWLDELKHRAATRAIARPARSTALSPGQ